MDDVPAGPASPEPRRPSLSVVVPVRNGGRDFERCLRRLRDSLLTDFELIVVDDGSTDDSAAWPPEAGATVVRDPDAAGPGGRAEPGAPGRHGPLDLLPRRRCRRPSPKRWDGHWPGSRPTRASRPSSARTTTSPAAPGSSASTATCSIISSTSRDDFDDGIRPAHTFWTGCGIIRRDVFLEFGGFDPRLYPRPAIEDIELGYRLTRAGHRIVLARDVLATHMKRWTLAEMVRTDIFRRGVPWMLLIKRTGTIETDLNVKADQKACVALTGLTLLAALCSRRRPLGRAVALAGAGGDRRS